MKHFLIVNGEVWTNCRLSMWRLNDDDIDVTYENYENLRWNN